jgi:hypothetical protein
MFCQVTAILYPLSITYLITFNTFACAYLGGSYKCIVDINKYGEANTEILMWFVITPFVLYGTIINIMMINDYLRGRLNERNIKME